ncbi:MAG: sialate O-acetylesterase [Oscillospiraceae bacterium]
MKFTTAAVFSNDMVLQRGKNINVFGTGEDGTRITVGLLGRKASCTVKNGRWLAVLPPMSETDNTELTVTDGTDTVVFYNVAVGEVWLAGGQSNMEFELRNCTGGSDALQNDDKDSEVRVRFFYTPKKTVGDDDYEQSFRQSAWRPFSDKNSAPYWSAVGYFFAKELSEQLGVTVGIIGCNWGGTSASAWMKREYAQGETAVYFEEYDKACEGKSYDELVKAYRDYQEYHAAWEKKSAEYYTNTPNPDWDGCLAYCGPNLYPGPASPVNPMSPGVLHESMIEQVCPYTLAGFIYYQGESDDHRPQMYYTLFTQLIRNWREDWHDDALPFICAQLPMHRYSGDEDRKNWCLIREAQMRAFNTIKNMGMAVIIDCGEFNEIHPKNKKPVGHRFALQALDRFYGGCDGANAPMIKNAVWLEDSVELSFCYADGGFVFSGEPGGFEICGEDGVYVPAKAEYYGEKIVLSAENIANPRGARYLWTNYGDVTVYGRYGLPLAPFRITIE